MTDPLDALLGDDEEPTTDSKDEKGNAAFAEMRKTNKQLQKELEELKAFKAERDKADRTNTISSVFGEVGLNPKWSEFYAGEDTSPDAIKAWALDKGFIAPSEDDTPAEPVERGYTPTVVAEAAVLGSKTYSYEDWRKLAATDEAKAMQLWKAGRVQPEVPPWDTGTPVEWSAS